MAIKPILQLGDGRLRDVSVAAQDPAAREIAELIADLQDTLAHSRQTTGYGRGIAAPQLGVALRVAFLQLPGREPWPLINPVITQRSVEKIVVWDACLSFLCIFMQVERHRRVTVRYQDQLGAWHEVHADETDDLAELLQHEIDHLDGVLCIDRVSDVKTICTKDEFEKHFRQNSPYAAKAT
jgi:peptide deformylase